MDGNLAKKRLTHNKFFYYLSQIQWPQNTN